MFMQNFLHRHVRIVFLANQPIEMFKLEVTIARKVLPHPQGMAPAQFAE